MADVLFLGPADAPLLAWLREREARVAQTAAAVSAASLAADGHDFLVSYGYRHILRPEVLALFPGRAVNLHISLLPWNRGADPNLWSFVEDTPKGVSIHYLDEGVDTGDLIAQQELRFDEPGETLASTHAALCAAVEALFREFWPAIREQRCPRRPQAPGGSLHRSRDRERLAPLLRLGWETPVAELVAARGKV